MKKLFSILIATIVAFSPVYAQTKKDAKTAKKEAKLAAKDLQREGYKLLELGDLQIQLEDYLLKAKSGQKQIVGTAEGCMSLNLAKTTALNNDDIVGVYERLVLKEIKGEIQTCVTLVKETKKKYDVRVYCLVDYDAAHAARMKAMRLALEELELTQKYGTEVSNWIDEGLNK